MLSNILTNRLQRELLDLEKDPPPGVSCYPKEDNITELEAFIRGPPDSPYEEGLFKLDIRIPENYPFDPPQIRFVTLIYHPNIDDTGRICADILKKGQGWNPALNLSTTLLLLNQLLAQPNPDDPLDADIAKEYQLNYPTFKQKAMEYTQKYANKDAQDTSITTNDNSTAHQSTQQPSDQIDTKEDEDLYGQERSMSQKKSKLSLSKKKSSLEKTTLQKTSDSPDLLATKSDKPTKNSADRVPSEAVTELNRPLNFTDSLDARKKPILKSDKSTHKSVVQRKGLVDTCTVVIERKVPVKEKEPSSPKKATFVNNKPVLTKEDSVPKLDQLLVIDAEQDEAKSALKKRTFSQLFDKEIIVLSDDEENGYSNSAPVLHSLQLDRKQKRTKLLSLSKKKHKA